MGKYIYLILLTENNITKSNSEARRIITSGGFKIEMLNILRSGHIIRQLDGKNLQIGKRKFLRINKK